MASINVFSQEDDFCLVYAAINSNCVATYVVQVYYLSWHSLFCQLYRPKGSAPPILARSVFLIIRQLSIKFHFYKKQVITKLHASAIFGLVRLVILSYNRPKKHIKGSKLIGCPRIQFIVMLTRYSAVQKEAINIVAVDFQNQLVYQAYNIVI